MSKTGSTWASPRLTAHVDDGRAYLQTLHFGQVGDHAILGPENSGAGHIKDRYGENE